MRTKVWIPIFFIRNARESTPFFIRRKTNKVQHPMTTHTTHTYSRRIPALIHSWTSSLIVSTINTIDFALFWKSLAFLSSQIDRSTKMTMPLEKFFSDGCQLPATLSHQVARRSSAFGERWALELTVRNRNQIWRATLHWRRRWSMDSGSCKHIEQVASVVIPLRTLLSPVQHRSWMAVQTKACI